MIKLLSIYLFNGKKKCDFVCFNNNCVFYLVREKKFFIFLKKIEDLLSK